MANKSYSKAKGRNEKGRFVALPHRCLEHENFTRLTTKATKLFLDIAFQFNGSNNGDLTAAFTIMKKRGWNSKETLRLAIDELLHYGWITRTRIGGLNRTPNLYALTIHAIDECGGKLDVKPTIQAPGNWNQLIKEWVKPANYIARQTRRNRKSLVRKPYLIGTDTTPLESKNQ